MERQLSNVSFHSYQDYNYQPTRKYGPQYEPGGYAALVQKRSDMTQRKDAVEFEQGRIKALQEERLHIQKKTFTKWMNSFLQKARMEVEDLFIDLADGRRLLKLLEIISGERLPRPNSGRMRVHKIENVNKSLSFLHTKVRLESIGAEDIVDGNPRLILGLIWTIILRFQIQEIEIDVDEENESSEKKSAKDALLLWCQRKTNGYHGVHIHNFSDSWRSGLGFNALIHAHRPDLFRWSDLPVRDHVETLNHAFDVAHENLGIPKLLDAEDVDTTRPDEKSVMTYVASYYHTFARMKNEQKSGKRIANIIGQLMDVDSRKGEYSLLMSALLEWIRMKMVELSDRDLPNSLDGIQRLLLAFKQYRTVEKPPKYKERSEIEALYFDMNTQHKSLVGEPWSPPEGQLPQDLERAWQQLEQAEHARELALRTELLRQQRLEQLNYKFNTKSVLRKGYLKEMIQVLSDPRYGSNLAQVDATVKKHEAISADILARKERFSDLSMMSAELVRERYHASDAVAAVCADVLARWDTLLELLDKHRAGLARLAMLTHAIRDADTLLATCRDMKTQFDSDEVGRHLTDVERLLQAHALQELQLNATDEAIKRLVRQGKAMEGPVQPKQQLDNQLKLLEEEYDRLVAAAKDRKARLEDARNLYQFLEDHDEEEGWVIDKQRLCRTEVSAKDLRGVEALRQKHQALVHEMRARDHVCQRHRSKGQSLIEAKHPKSAEIERRLSSLHEHWETLKKLVEAREKQLENAALLYQFMSDANSMESWLKSSHPLVYRGDCGEDTGAATALLSRHKALHTALLARRHDMDALRAAAPIAAKAMAMLPAEAEAAPIEEEEWVNESRLVPTEVWEEEPVERLEHRTVTEERSVPQVKALYPFSGQGISMVKGEVMFLLSKTNPDWWSVRKADRSDGFVPANYVREIEPRLVPVQVRRPEKVRTVQRVKKTVLVKQTVPVRRVTPRRRLQRTASVDSSVGVHERMKALDDGYDELLKLSEARRIQLEDAIKLFSLFADCDDLDKWMKEKEKMLNTDEPDETVDAARRKYEKFVTDLSAASKRLENIVSATEELVSSGHPQASKAVQRTQQLKQQWDRLLKLKKHKEKSLEGASSVELFGRTCDEAMDWMVSKSSQLEQSGATGDVRDVRALQRRHAQLEREMEPLREKIHTVGMLCDSVKSQYPSERLNVEARQRQIEEMWAQCSELAASRRNRLESAVGHQIFDSSWKQLGDWLQQTRSALSVEAAAKDVATAESLHKQHQELMDDIKTKDDEFEEVIGLGKKLVANNPTLTDVSDKIKYLENEKAAIHKEWQDKDRHLQQLVQLAMFNREADQLEAASSAHQAYLDYNNTGSSVDEVEALMKRHEELEARLAAHDEKRSRFAARAKQLTDIPHPASEHITARTQHVLSRRDALRHAAAERRRALQAALAYHQFLAATEDLQAWIDDKTRTATDQSYRDLANLERKLQKHEAFERELQANEKQLRNVESVGQSLQKSDPIRAKEVVSRLESLQRAWAGLVAASRDKGSKLRQAHAQRAHKRSIEDAKSRLAELERGLTSEVVGSDMSSCKRLLNQHQALEQELLQWEQKAESLVASGQDLVSSGHFDAPAIETSSKALLAEAAKLKGPTAERKRRLDTSLQLHKYIAAVKGELDWLSERRSAAESEVVPADLHQAQHNVKKHGKLKNELIGRRPIIERVIARGQELVDEKHPDSEKIKQLSAELEAAYKSVSEAAESRGSRLEAFLKAAQFLHEAHEVESWINDAAAALGSADVGRDRHRATSLLTRHKAVELEVDTYAAIIAEMGHVAQAMAAGGHPSQAQLLATHSALQDALARLQRLAAARQKALVGSVCRHEYLAESAELDDWIQEQLAAASSDDYGQDYEHLLILVSKFEELRHRVESAEERFNQCEELAKKLLATESPYIAEIEKRQATLGIHWQQLVEQIGIRASRLRAAGDIHRFHRDAADLLALASEKRARLATARDVDGDLVALDAQVQVLEEEGARLRSLYPGENDAQIQLQLVSLAAARESLRAAANDRKEQLRQEHALRMFNTQVRDLTSWSSSVRTAMLGDSRVRDANSAQAARADHDAIKAEIEARDDSFRQVLQMADEMVQAGHPASQEIEEKSEALLAERSRLHSAWASRQVSLDQLIDLHCFLRDAAQLTELCNVQDAALSSEISPTLSVEEVDNLLKKHEAFEKLLVTQDEKLAMLNSHGDKLLQQNHVESQRIADELKKVNARRKQIHALCASRHSQLKRALLRAKFARDVAEERGWCENKLHALHTHFPQGEVVGLEDKIKKLQKHQAFKAELAANEARIREVEQLAAQLGNDDQVAKDIAGLRNDWVELVKATEEKGRGLEEAQDILEFNQYLDKIEAWIRQKEMMVQAHSLGRDYEHCTSLLRTLDDLDSDMKMDEKHVKAVQQLADKLLQQGPSQQASSVAQRRDAFLAKWRALSGALQEYRDNLTAALEIHAFHRDVEETSARLSSKAAVLRSSDQGKSLSGARELRRRHDATLSEARVVADKIGKLAKVAEDLVKSHPERAEEIESSIAKLNEDWDTLQELAAKRSALLDDALAVHKFDEGLKEIELWVSETIKRMNSAEPAETVAEAEAALQIHDERKAEIDGRQKSIQALQKQAESQLAGDPGLPEKLAKLTQLSKTLDDAWLERRKELELAHELQILYEKARETEDWLTAKEAFLNNDDLGEDLEAAERLIAKHSEFSKLLESQWGRCSELTELREAVSPHIAAIDTVDNIAKRAETLKESCKHRGEMLEQSKQLHQFLRNLHHEREWIDTKIQQANDQNYRDLSNLQSKIQKHAAFESELAANKGRIDDVVNHGEELIEANHYASNEISQHVEHLDNLWRELQEASKLRRDRLQEAYQARVYLRGLDDFTLWLDEVESQLLSEDHGKDLTSVTALLKRHTRLEQQVASKSDVATQLAENAQQLAESKHFMAEEILARAEDAVKRYRQLQEPMQIRRDNLEDAEQLHRWERDFEEEMKWLEEREPALNSEELGSTLAQAQALQKKHLALQAELIAREPTLTAVCTRAATLAAGGHYGGGSMTSRAEQLAARGGRAGAAAAARAATLRTHITALQLLAEMSEMESSLKERRAILTSSDVGRDEESVLTLLKKLDGQRRELSNLDAAISKLCKATEKLAKESSPTKELEQVTTKMSEVQSMYEELKLLSAKREQRLQQSLKYFKFVQECSETQEWIVEQMSVAASEEYGLDVEHVETLQQGIDNFLHQLNANEGRIEAVCEAGNVLLEENTPEAERVKQKIEDIKGLWEDLKELALARQEALAGARQVHEFDRSAEETAAWLAQRLAALAGERGVRAAGSEIAILTQRYKELRERADKLGEAFPDAKEHVFCKLEEVAEALHALEQKTQECSRQLELAGQLRTYFETCQQLMAWTSETLARVTAPELARDVEGAGRLVRRHKDIHTEILAKNPNFDEHYSHGEKLIKEGHLMSSEIKDRMDQLKSRKQLLDVTWAARDKLYEQHLDALVFKRDADALDNWISTRVPLVRDGKLGESVSQVEELINRHRDLEETIEAQKDRVEALKRITLVEKAFKQQQDAEAAARKESAERAEKERLEQYRRKEMERIAQQRRMESAPAVQLKREPDQQSLNQSISEETLSPAPQFDKLPKTDAGVKRAESMQVSTKTPKRTPSFTTRRRTQSFRRHRQADIANLPPVEIEGFLDRKQEAGCGGKRAPVRSWRSYHSVLCGQLLCFFRDEIDFASNKAAAPPVAIANARCSIATDYTKRAHVFRLSCADGAEYLFATSSASLLNDWVAKIAFHAALPPELQLTPYHAGDSPTAELRRRLHQNASSSSSESSPQPVRKPRSQAEILHEHRVSQMSNKNADRIIESTVLPSLPPRQMENKENSSESLKSNEPGWGRSRFSNGRDINAEFIRSQREAYGTGNRPASVAGSGGSPALDQRPASRSSGESELSIGGNPKDKKDKKGVFGGLFSRKKRPTSHHN